MPTYVYRATEEGHDCEHCRDSFEIRHPMGDRLEVCPECGVPIDKVPQPVGMSVPKGPSDLRSMGMARLEKRSDGSYENVSAQPGEQRVGSLDSFSKSLTKGPKRIISD